MNSQNMQPLLIQRLFQALANKCRQYAAPLIAGFLAGMLAHGFAFANKLLNHDEIGCLFSKGSTAALGRWGLDLIVAIFPNYSMPWLYGIVSLLLLMVAACLIASFLQIHSRSAQALLAALVVTFPSLTGTFTYMFTSSAYAVSFLLAVLAVYFPAKGGKCGFFLGLVAMVFSLSLYQAYVSITASLFVILLISRLLLGENPRDVFRQGVIYVAFLLVGLAIYYVLTQAILKLQGLTFSNYAEGGMSIDFAALPKNVLITYYVFLHCFLENWYGLIPTEFSSVLHIGVMLCCGMLAFTWLFGPQKRQLGQVLLLMALLFLMPFAINCIYLISPFDHVHTLVLYSFVNVYVLAIVLAQNCPPVWDGIGGKLRVVSLNILPVLLAGIIGINTVVANEGYLRMYLQYENTYAFYTSLVSQLSVREDVDQNTKLAILGAYPATEANDARFPAASRITGTGGIQPTDYTRSAFVLYYLGLDIPFASDEEIAAIQETPEVQDMAVYPYAGSVKKIGDILVVRLS